MRKWMQEKLKRRKKSQDAAPNQPAPLQPAYFEPGEQAEAKGAAPGRVEEEFQPAAEPVGAVSEGTGEGGEGEAGKSEPTSPEGADSAAPEDPRRPRRRRRGGRGRRRPGPKPAARPAEVAPAAEASPTHSAARAASAPSVPEVPAAARPRASKGTVVLAIGLPGSGKSSWFKRHNLSPLSSDMIRAMLFDDPTEQRFQDLVFSNLRSMLRARLVARMPLNYVDATNLTPHDRGSWIKLAKDFGYDPQAAYFDLPPEACPHRHPPRHPTVPEPVIRQTPPTPKP